MLSRAILTGLVKHLVTLIEDEMLEVGEAEVAVTDESVDATGRANNDMGMGLLVAEKLDVLLNGSSTVEDADLDIWQKLGETVVFIPDLIGQLTSVAHDQDRGDARLRLLVHLLQGREYEDSRLSETRFGLAEDIVPENGLGDGNLLDCRAQCMSERFLKRSKRSSQSEASVHLA